ncbi:hypothetical protein Ddc_03032 [Ditylenchus destructor]|nr:hypothetical protein Ddc_03032 [Ditylenchus destructor]
MERKESAKVYGLQQGRTGRKKNRSKSAYSFLSLVPQHYPILYYPSPDCGGTTSDRTAGPRDMFSAIGN